MTDLLDLALDRVRALSSAEQDEIARAMLSLAGVDAEPEPVDPEDLAAVMEGLAQARRGQRATPERVEAAYRRFEA